MEITNKTSNSVQLYLSTILSVQVLSLLAVGLLLGIYWTHCSRPSDVLIGLGIMGIALHLATGRERKNK